MTRIYKMKKRPVADGYRGGDRDRMPRFVVRFDEDTYAEVKAIALKRSESFAHVVRMLVEWGLETYEEDERKNT